MKGRISLVAVCLGVAFVSGSAPAAEAQVSCAGVPAFASCTQYANGAAVTYNGSKYHSIALIPTDRDCPPNHPYNPGNDNWWVNDGSCSSLPTPTRTSATATATRMTPTNGMPTPTRTSTATATPTSTTGGNCAGVPAFQSCTAYPQGQMVVFNNRLYELLAAISAVRDCPPTAPFGPSNDNYWLDRGACTGGTATPPTPTPTSVTATPTSPRPTPTPTTCGLTTCGGALPAKVITGYWHNFSNGSTVMKLRDVPTKYNLIAVAFADNAGAGAISFTLDPAVGYSGSSEFISDVNTLHSRGQKVIISVGGQNGSIVVGDSGAATNFANSVVSLMNTFGFDGVDIDLENGVSPQFMAQALHSVASAKPGAIITMAPETIFMQSAGATYLDLALRVKDVLTIVNTQFYNSGCMLGCDGVCYSEGTENFLTGLACIQVQAGLRGDQIGLGLPAVSAAAPSGGYVSPSTINAALNCMKSGTSCGSFVPPVNGRATLRGVMTWSINWDATSGYAWVNGIAIP